MNKHLILDQLIFGSAECLNHWISIFKKWSTKSGITYYIHRIHLNYRSQMSDLFPFQDKYNEHHWNAQTYNALPEWFFGFNLHGIDQRFDFISNKILNEIMSFIKYNERLSIVDLLRGLRCLAVRSFERTKNTFKSFDRKNKKKQVTKNKKNELFFRRINFDRKTLENFYFLSLEYLYVFIFFITFNPSCLIMMRYFSTKLTATNKHCTGPWKASFQQPSSSSCFQMNFGTMSCNDLKHICQVLQRRST